MTFQVTIPILNHSVEHPELKPFSLFFNSYSGIKLLDVLKCLSDGSTNQMHLDCIAQLERVSLKDANIPVDSVHMFKIQDPVFGKQYITVEKINVISL
jgi:hypothetical protein